MDWDKLARGDLCPFDTPRQEPNSFWDSVQELQVSTLCLLTNQAYRGHCILIYDPDHVVRPDQLSAEQWSRFCDDLHRAVRALMSVCRADHINVECLGNQMPHLHWQIIPRYRSDPRWSGPIWTTTIEELHERELPGLERQQLISELRAALA